MKYKTKVSSGRSSRLLPKKSVLLCSVEQKNKMSEIKTEFEVYCSCGQGLCASTKVDYRRTENRGTVTVLVVEPCETCKTKSWNKGYGEAVQDYRNSL